MARVHPIFASFTSGELTPLLGGRVDFAKYASGLRTLINYLIRPHGPVFNRPGTHFVAEVKDSTKATRLIPFEFSTTQAYVIEAGNLYFRFYKDGGRIEEPVGTPIEIVTPYTDADLPLLKYIQSADTMYLFHPNHAIRKLTRQSHTAWTLVTANLMPPPTYEAGFLPATTLTLSATTGLGITLTAGAAVFEDSDVGRVVTVGTGRAVIRTVAAGPVTSATADVVDDFASVGPHASQAWTIQGSPNSSLTPSISQPAHAIGTLTLAARGWRSTDAGRYVRVNKGVVRITKFTSATVVEAELLTALANTTASPGGSWSLEDPVWSAARGHPRGGTFHEQRMAAGGSASNPQTFFGSASGEYEVFALGPDDDDAYEFAIAANQVNVINWLIATRSLKIGTASTEFTAKGSEGAANAAISPNSIDVKASTFWGSSDRVTPIRIGNAVLFVTRTGRELRELVFSVERDSDIANDLLLLSSHLTDGFTIVAMAYQRTPNSVVWCVRSDGTLLALTYQREHDVAGWSRMLTGPTQQLDQGVDTDNKQILLDAPSKGKFEDVVVIPHWNGDRDVSWFVVNRTIGGATKRYVEYHDDVNGFYGRLGMDSALTYSGAAATVLTGLAHLNGETVTIVGNGAVYPTAVVASGQITLDGPAVTQAEVGLGFTSILETMRPEVPQQGTSQGLMKHWSKIWVRLYRSIGLWVNGDEVNFRLAGADMDKPPARFTGDKDVPHVGRDRDGIIRIEQRDPLPQTVVAIFGTLAVGE